MRPTRMQQSFVTVETMVSTESPIENVTEIHSKHEESTSGSTINALNTTNDENVESKKLEKSSQSIKTILIGLSWDYLNEIFDKILYFFSVNCCCSDWVDNWSYMS